MDSQQRRFFRCVVQLCCGCNKDYLDSKTDRKKSWLKKNLVSSTEYKAVPMTQELQKSLISGCLENIWIKYHAFVSLVLFPTFHWQDHW